MHGRLMDNLQAQIEERINVMVGEILVVVRRAAIEAVNNSLSGTGAVAAPTSGRRTAKRRKPSRAPKKHRSAKELASLSKRLYAEIEKSPGQGMALYAEKLGMPVRALSRPMQHLKKAEEVRTMGERDRMRYFPMGSA